MNFISNKMQPQINVYERSLSTIAIDKDRKLVYNDNKMHSFDSHCFKEPLTISMGAKN
jgi:hypothetical protein